MASIQASTRDVCNTELVRQSWAIWMVVLVVIYGVLPRLLLMLFCRWRWKHGLARLQLDLKLPGYSQLRERLMPSSERLGVNDAAPEQLHRVEGGVSAQDSNGTPCWWPSSWTSSAPGHRNCRTASRMPASSTAASRATACWRNYI